MVLLQRIRYLVIVVSLVIFCYQIDVALYNLMSDDTVDSTEYIPISHLDPLPIITFCPRQEEDWKNGEKGFASIDHLLKGMDM